MQRIKTISTYMCIILNILLIAFPIYVTIKWFLIDWESFEQLGFNNFLFEKIETPEGAVNPHNILFTNQIRFIAIFTSLFKIFPVWLGCYFLRYVFKNYKNEQIFILTNVKFYQKLGWVAFINALFFQPLSHLGMVLVATLSNPPGHRYISLTFGTPNLESIFYGVILIIISSVMLEGHRLQSEQELTI